MPRVLFLSHDGVEYPVDAHAGDSLMAAALDNAVPGIDAECGGGCACGTCHVYIDAVWADRVAPVADMEEGMLDFVHKREETSRLACQVTVDDALDGLVVRIPASQF